MANLIRERRRGAYRGRKKALAPERVAELRCCAPGGKKKAQLAREFGVSRETLYQYLKADGWRCRAAICWRPPC